MGVFTDWLDNQIVLGERPYTAHRRVAYNEIRWHIRREDPTIHPDLDAAHEIQGFTETNQHSFASYKLIFTTPDGVVIETTSMPVGTWLSVWNDVVHAACDPVIPDWTHGDISYVSGRPNRPDPLVFEFAGDSVAGQNWPATQAEWTSWLSGPLTPVTYQNGHGPRLTWGVIYELGLYGPATHDPGDDLPDGAELLKRPDETIRWPSASLRAMLAQQAAIDDGYPPMEQQLRNLFNIG
ncbi:MAG: hypothetical protein ACYTFQ_23030 [Planctomycetota bacterium]|jgi:hypothetical protein